MSGIAGWINDKKDIRNQTHLQQKMLHTLVKRGPDEEGVYEEEHCLFMHRRLAIMDQKHGQQPMQYEQYVMVYNGELFDTKELKEDLMRHGYEFTSTCDSEVLIKAYHCYKEACIDKINGFFAFAIWDKETKHLFLARDRIGIKPLFYYQCDHELLFASEMKTLLVHPNVKPIIKEEGLKELFLLGPARTSGKMPIDKIYELKPGECASYDAVNGLQKRTYWALQAKEHTENKQQTIDHLKQLVTTCINDQLDSDAGMGCFLSGGLDSSIICKVASRRFPELNTYSVDYEGNDQYFKQSVFQPNRDEDFIKLMVKDLNSKHHSYVLTQEEIVEALYEATIARDLPGMAEVDSSMLLFAKEVKQHTSVAMSGEGADEIFGGYPWYYNEEVLWKDEFPWSHSYDVRTACLKDGLINDGEAYVKKAYFQSISDVSYLPNDGAKDRRMREMFMLNVRWFAQTLLDRKDRMSMYAGLEMRLPFIDYRIVEYAYNMPWRYKSMNGREKGILREAFKDELPTEITQRKKSPYPKTHHPKYTQILIKKLRDILNQENLLSQILDKEKVEEFIHHIDTIETPWYGQLMKGPQILAYFIQMHYFFEEYQVQLSL